VLFLKDDPGPPEAAARTALNLHPDGEKEKSASEQTPINPFASFANTFAPSAVK
jgi:hypothetical protein